MLIHTLPVGLFFSALVARSQNGPQFGGWADKRGKNSPTGRCGEHFSLF